MQIWQCPIHNGILKLLNDKRGLIAINLQKLLLIVETFLHLFLSLKDINIHKNSW